MSVTYMITWTILVIFAVGFGRIRDMRQTFGIAAITLLILIMSQTLAAQLASTVGLAPNLIYSNPELFLMSGPIGIGLYGGGGGMSTPPLSVSKQLTL